MRGLFFFFTLLVFGSIANGEDFPVITDIALARENVLIGRLVNGNGVAKIKEELVITDLRNRQEVARCVTNEDGIFSTQVPRGSVYAVTADTGFAVVRAWTPGTAPPSANNAILVVCEPERIRGQCPRGGDNVRTMAALTACVGVGYMVYLAVDNKSGS